MLKPYIGICKSIRVAGAICRYILLARAPLWPYPATRCTMPSARTASHDSSHSFCLGRQIPPAFLTAMRRSVSFHFPLPIHWFLFAFIGGSIRFFLRSSSQPVFPDQKIAVKLHSRAASLRLPVVAPAHDRRQRHQDSFGAPARLQAEQRAAIVDEVELDVAPAAINPPVFNQPGTKRLTPIALDHSSP